MRPTEVLFVAVPLLVAIACDMHDPEGSPQACCPKRIHESLKRAGGVAVNDPIRCGFGPSYFRVEDVGAALQFEHGIEALTEECYKLLGCEEVFESGNYMKIDQCSSCRFGRVGCGGSADIGVEPSCDGLVPDLHSELAEYGIPYFRLIYDAGLGTVVEKYQDHHDRNYGVFYFRAKPDPRDQSVVERFFDGDYRVEIAGSCECRPFIAPPETDCAPDQWE